MCNLKKKYNKPFIYLFIIVFNLFSFFSGLLILIINITIW